MFLTGEAGYQKVMDITGAQFCRPHDVAQSFMNELPVKGSIAPGYVGALRRLIRTAALVFPPDSGNAPETSMVNTEGLLTSSAHSGQVSDSYRDTEQTAF
ncbi:hypothetical protein T265_10542 [Opisthorchis viverrini]|uniref:Uncharacterized protein n=1 Tax=Opisthorchis viverrini TaxID=6198 RepID=A0A074Z1X9_OPIVI|nr:hypothetical protein T265_10542 [Opisthorchis viverrini]KER21051.1 hypothetical protein T265_10542 [Opisthorchis viverrini]